MSIILVVGPKGGIGKTTLAINTTAALTRALASSKHNNRICLVDLDLRLPTITSLLDSHPSKTFYDLFECLGKRTYQTDFLKIVYRLATSFRAYINGKIPARNEKGSVQGNITAGEIICKGKMEGDVSAGQKLTLHSTGTLMGDVVAPAVQIAPGAMFKGKCKFGNPELKAARKKEERVPIRSRIIQLFRAG